MNTREKAYSIFNRLSEDELKGFILLFEKAYPPEDINNDLVKRRASFERLEKMRKHIPNLDDEKELDAYMREKYGI